MIKKTLYFGNPAYLSLRNQQLVIRLPEVEKNDSLPESFKRKSEVTKPIEDIGVVILDNKIIKDQQFIAINKLNLISFKDMEKINSLLSSAFEKNKS